MKNVGQVLHLFVSIQNTKQRVEQFSLHFDVKGIKKDKFYNKDIHRSVLITSLESYKLAKQFDISISYGSLGENLLIDYNPYLLQPGTVIQIGEVHLEISQNCTICEHLSIIDKRLPTLLEKDRGIFAKVVKEGVIHQEDKVYLLD